MPARAGWPGNTCRISPVVLVSGSRRPTGVRAKLSYLRLRRRSGSCGSPLATDLEVGLRPRDTARLARARDHLAPPHHVALAHQKGVVVGVRGHPAALVPDEHEVPVPSELVAGVGHHTVPRGANLAAHGHGDVDPVIVLAAGLRAEAGDHAALDRPEECVARGRQRHVGRIGLPCQHRERGWRRLRRVREGQARTGRYRRLGRRFRMGHTQAVRTLRSRRLALFAGWRCGLDNRYADLVDRRCDLGRCARVVPVEARCFHRRWLAAPSGGEDLAGKHELLPGQQPIGVSQVIQSDDRARRHTVAVSDAIEGIACRYCQQQRRLVPRHRWRRSGLRHLEGRRHPLLRRGDELRHRWRRIGLKGLVVLLRSEAERECSAGTYAQEHGRHKGAAHKGRDQVGLSHAADHSMTSRSHVRVRR